MLLTSSCSQQNHTKYPQPLPMRCESTCHLVEHIISSWRKTKQKNYSLSDHHRSIVELSAHPSLPQTCPFSPSSVSLLRDSSLILSVLARVEHFAFLSITLPYLQPQLSSRSLLPPPTLPPFPSSRGHTVSYGTVVVLKASSLTLWTPGWLLLCLSATAIEAEWTGEASAAHYHVVKKTNPTENSQTHPGRMQRRVPTETRLTNQRVIVVLVSFGNKALHFICVRNVERISNFSRLLKPLFFFKPSRKMFQMFFLLPCAHGLLSKH